MNVKKYKVINDFESNDKLFVVGDVIYVSSEYNWRENCSAWSYTEHNGVKIYNNKKEYLGMFEQICLSDLEYLPETKSEIERVKYERTHRNTCPVCGWQGIGSPPGFNNPNYYCLRCKHEFHYLNMQKITINYENTNRNNR